MSETEPSGDGYSRRRALLAVGTGLAAALAGCSNASRNETATGTTARTTATTTHAATATGEESPQPTQASGRLGEQFAAVRSATEQYADPSVARRDGYTVLGPYMDGMGWHFLDQGRVAQAESDGPTREKPPMLTYVRTDEGLSLASVEYVVPVDSTSEDPDLFVDGPEGLTERWGSHRAATHVFATPDTSQRDFDSYDLDTLLTDEYWAEFRPADETLEAGDTTTLDWGSTEGKSGDRTMRTVDGVITHPDLRTLHVWLHEDNPDGVFAESNPRFAEGNGGHHHGTASHDH
jgi:hypothetical protein